MHAFIGAIEILSVQRDGEPDPRWLQDGSKKMLQKKLHVGPSMHGHIRGHLIRDAKGRRDGKR
jgi:hypothetical protein